MMNYKALILLPLVVFFLHVQAAPIVKRQVDYIEREANDLAVMHRAILLTHGGDLKPKEELPIFFTGQKTLCYMQDRHTDYYFKLQNVLRNDENFNRFSVEEFSQNYEAGEIEENISEKLVEAASKEYVSREILRQTCRWVETTGSITGCSKDEISQSCAGFELQVAHNEIVPLFDDYKRAFSTDGRNARVNATNCDWLLQKRPLQENIFKKIANLMNCT